MQGARLSRFPFRGNASTGRSQKPEEQAQPVSERLPLFSEALLRGAALDRCVVLDFAPASAASIAVLNELPCRVDIVDFPAVLPALLRARDAGEFRRVLARCLPAPHGAKPARANLVLCWDFLNYLSRSAIRLLAEELAPRCAEDVQLHALIAYSADMMPARPCRYTPAGREGVLIRPQVAEQREAPRYAPKDLLRCLPGFDIDRAMMLRNGYQEYLLRQAPVDDVPRLRPGDKLPREAALVE